jgi:hypothetical protein
MARFYGTVSGQAKTTATRRGSARSGLETQCNGWNCGVTVEADGYDSFDFFHIYLTTGSSPKDESIHLGTVFVDDDDKVSIAIRSELFEEGVVTTQ